MAAFNHIILPADINRHWLWANDCYIKWWLDMLLLASNNTGEIINGVMVEVPGEMYASERTFAQRWNVSRRQVTTFFGKLEKSQMASFKVSQKVRHITICVLNDYTDICANRCANIKKGCANNAPIGAPIMRQSSNNKSMVYIEGCANNEPIGAPIMSQSADDTKEKESNIKKNKECLLFNQKEIQKEKVLTAEDFIAMYHLHCPSFPKVVKLSDQRKKAIKARIREMATEDVIISVFDKMEAAGWLAQTTWCKFDWLIANSNNWVKVYEGNYERAFASIPVAPNKPAKRESVNDEWE